MQVALYSSRPFEKPFFGAANAAAGHELTPLDVELTLETAPLAAGYPAVSLFAGDDAGAPVLELLQRGGTRLLALRSAGFNHVDVARADALGLTVLRVPAYSPNSVAEHALALMLTLNRKTHRAYNRVREQNFSIEGLMGFDMHGKTVGLVGTGKIGTALARALLGLGCRVLGFDPYPAEDCAALGVVYVDLDELLAASDIVSLHCPLTPSTRHLIDARALALMKPSAMLINTCRGAVIDTRALIGALKSSRLGAVGLDVYEEEGDLFFQDLSGEVLHDDVFVRLMTFPNVLITGHQGFFTREACQAIAQTTIDNITAFERGTVDPAHVVSARLLAGT
ncbi:MAG TPA: 2-hydroxyacid dehydrogenase [Planctomycetota bacterium]|nr:2-hydroxyacid dehydrogenase [Planctomycetota bacterium]